jgi:hypothetical protein
MKIWVTPIQIGENGNVQNHPAFFLPGQELVSGNIRAFAALEPCKTDGKSCTSGIDCCDMTLQQCIGGYCALPKPM